MSSRGRSLTIVVSCFSTWRNPCIKCMECSVTQFGVSEFCETLTGGFTRETPRRSNSQKSENLEEWNTQSGGIARGVELPVDSLLPFIKSRNQWEPEPMGSHWFRLFMKGRGVELPWAGTPREVAFSRGWNSQEGLLISQIQAPSSQIQLSKRVCPEVSQKRLIPRSISVKN